MERPASILPTPIQGQATTRDVTGSTGQVAWGPACPCTPSKSSCGLAEAKM